MNHLKISYPSTGVAGRGLGACLRKVREVFLVVEDRLAGHPWDGGSWGPGGPLESVLGGIGGGGRNCQGRDGGQDVEQLLEEINKALFDVDRFFSIKKLAVYDSFFVHFFSPTSSIKFMSIFFFLSDFGFAKREGDLFY